MNRERAWECFVMMLCILLLSCVVCAEKKSWPGRTLVADQIERLLSRDCGIQPDISTSGFVNSYSIIVNSYSIINSAFINSLAGLTAA